MTRSRSRTGSQKSPRVRGAQVGRPLDRLAREAIDCLAWVVARCGYSPEEIWRRAKWRCERIPRSATTGGSGTSRTADLAAHVLTLWFNDRGYVFPNGEARPLPVRGPAPSLEALVERVGAGLTLEAAMDYLLATRTLRKVGGRLVPRSQVVSHRGNPASQQAHHMRALVDFLRTLEHNTQARRSAPSWFQFAADNLHVPVRQRAAFYAHMQKSGTAFLKDKDAVMYRIAQARLSNEPTVPMTVGVYLSEGPESRTLRKSRRRSARRSVDRS